jgi:hypothetical protein
MASWRAVPSPRKGSKNANNVRSAALIGGSIVIVAVLALVLAKLIGSGGGKAAKPKTVDNSVGLVLKIGAIDVQSAGPPARIKTPVQQAVLDASQSYVDDAILAPVEKGKVKDKYAHIFGRGVRDAATGHDRAALTEVRTGKLKGKLTATASKVRLDGMGDQTGKVVLVAATFVVDVNAKGSGGPVKIQRLTELTFAPEDGRWVVTAYRVGVKRTTTAQTSAAVARAGTGAIQ